MDMRIEGHEVAEGLYVHDESRLAARFYGLEAGLQQSGNYLAQGAEVSFIGARSEIVGGVVVERGVVIAMGVYTGQSTRIYDRARDEVLYGRVHGGAAWVLCFAGHTDIVPPGPLKDWDHDPFEPEIDDGWLKGRGAADMKSGIAAMVRAGIDFVGDHPQHLGSVAFLITSDEEGPATDGARRVMDTLSARDETIDWCVVGKPSCSEQLGDTLRVGRRGSLSVIMTVHGEQGHVAFPALAQNPIQSFAPVLAEMYATPLDEGNEHFPPTSFQVVRVYADAGAANVFPGELATRFNFRFANQWRSEQIQEWVTSSRSRFVRSGSTLRHNEMPMMPV